MHERALCKAHKQGLLGLRRVYNRRMAERRPIREWWQPPRKAADRIAHRQVTFLELFYDLVYVVVIAELAHSLSGHLSARAVGEFFFLFFIVWFAWINGSSYTDIHGNNDLRTRVFTFLQMLTVIGMALFAHDAMGETSRGFALSYAAFQLILTYLWWRTGVYDKEHRPLSRPYSLFFLINTVLFAVSAFVPESLRFNLWIAAVGISLVLPLNLFFVARRNESARAEVEMVMQYSPSLVERFGLFNIIVLGEVIVGVLSGLSHQHELSGSMLLVGGLGALVAIALWWVYFDFVSHRIPRATPVGAGGWMYLHLPLTFGIAAVGAAMGNLIEQAGHGLTGEVSWLMAGAIAITLVSVSLLIRTIPQEGISAISHPPGANAMLLSAGLALLLPLFVGEALPFLGLAAGLILLPVAVTFWVYVNNPGID